MIWLIYITHDFTRHSKISKGRIIWIEHGIKEMNETVIKWSIVRKTGSIIKAYFTLIWITENQFIKWFSQINIWNWAISEVYVDTHSMALIISLNTCIISTCIILECICWMLLSSLKTFIQCAQRKLKIIFDCIC